MARLWYPDRSDIEVLVYQIAEEMFPNYDSISPTFSFLGGEQGRGLLDSALALPRQAFDGKPLYRTIFDKAAVLMRSIIKNHPFVDGNKRVAVASTALFLFMNGRLLFVPPDQLVEYALQIATEDSEIDWPEISAWLKLRCPYVQDIQQQKSSSIDVFFQFMPDLYRKLNHEQMAEYLRTVYDELNPP